MNLYTWHMSHATYRFLLFALTWYSITTNGQSIPRDTRTVFSLPLWLWVCALNTGASYSGERVHQMSIQNKCWVKFDSATCTLHWNNFPKQQWSPQWRRQGTHVGSTWSPWSVTNQHVRARPGAIEPWRACANGSQKDVRVSRSFFIF